MSPFANAVWQISSQRMKESSKGNKITIGWQRQMLNNIKDWKISINILVIQKNSNQKAKKKRIGLEKEILKIFLN